MNDDIIRKIKAMLNMTVENGCTPAEAAHAAAKAQEFMQKHSISMFDVESKTYGETVTCDDFELPGTRIPAWSWEMARAVCVGTDCDYYVTWKMRAAKKMPLIRFVGHTSDCKVATYLYATISSRLWKMSATEGRWHERSGAQLAKFRWDFMLGAAREIGSRLRNEKASMQQQAQASGAGAMVVVKDAAVKGWLTKHVPDLKTRTVGRARERDGEALLAGMRAGHNIDIRHGIERGAEHVAGPRHQLQ
jgi:hypothetical protein